MVRIHLQQMESACSSQDLAASLSEFCSRPLPKRPTLMKKVKEDWFEGVDGYTPIFLDEES